MNYAWLITVASIIGTVANIKKKRWCFYIWVVTNFLWMSINLYIKFYPQAFLFFIYFCLAIWGIIEWKTKREE